MPFLNRISIGPVVAIVCLVLPSLAVAGPRSACKALKAATMTPTSYLSASATHQSPPELKSEKSRVYSYSRACKFVKKHRLSAQLYQDVLSECPEAKGILPSEMNVGGCAAPWTNACRTVVKRHSAKALKIGMAQNGHRYAERNWLAIGEGILWGEQGVAQSWLSDEDVKCLSHHVERYMKSARTLNRGQDPRASYRVYRGTVERRNELWKAGHTLIEPSAAACEVLSGVGLSCQEVRLLQARGERAAITTADRSSAYSKAVATYQAGSASSRLLWIPSQSAVDAVGAEQDDSESKVDALMGLCQEMPQLMGSNAKSLKMAQGGSFASVWSDLCAVPLQASAAATWQAGACGDNSDCAAAISAVKKDEGLKAVIGCFGNDPSSCVAAYRALDQPQSLTLQLESLQRMLPLFASDYMVDLLQIEEDMKVGCVLGKNRFISDEPNACRLLTDHLSQLAFRGLQRGCQNEDLDSCLQILDSFPRKVDISQKVRWFERKCSERKDCGDFVQAIPRQSVCLERYSRQNGRSEYTFEVFWKPMLPMLAKRTTELCETEQDQGVAMGACVIADKASRNEGLFQPDCANERKDHKIQIQEAGERHSRCIEENSLAIARMYRGCAGKDFQTGNTTDVACDMRAVNWFCP